MAYNGKAPFVSATIVKAEGADASIRLDGAKAVLRIGKETWIISRKGVEKA
jgi:hypothetical protein